MPEETIKEEKKPEVLVQYVIVQLANGKRGIFIGPELISESELLLSPPKIVSVDFSKPRPRGEQNAEQTPIGTNTDTKVSENP